ncbi:MAG: biotin-dependent carboxyltransferase family protein [Isosphaeraceae bacterium]|nr:biotin-dependent carboxyltransferase family protein [Isosphaeraceae bacterium]
MSLRLVRRGTHATIQDGGRRGRRRWGVPWGGVADRESWIVANALVGNSPDLCAAVVESSGFGGEYLAEARMEVALAGAQGSPSIVRADGQIIELASPGSFALEAGDRLVLGSNRVGARVYVAVRGGFLTPAMLGSRSTENSIEIGEVLACESLPEGTRIHRRRLSVHPHSIERPLQVRIAPGPAVAAGSGRGEFERLIEPRTRFRVTADSNRVGLRLLAVDESGLAIEEGDPERSLIDRESGPVLPGTIQRGARERLIVGPAGGTMGGYAAIAQVITADLDRIGQAAPGDLIRFVAIDLASARKLQEARVARLKARAAAIAAVRTAVLE